MVRLRLRNCWCSENLHCLGDSGIIWDVDDRDVLLDRDALPGIHVLLGYLGSLPGALQESQFLCFREEISLSCSLNLLSTSRSLECIIDLVLVASCCSSSILALGLRSVLLTKLGSVTIGLMVPLFTEVFIDPEELLVRCRIDLSDAERENTISCSSSAFILDSFVS